MTRFFTAAAFALATMTGAAAAQEGATVEEMTLGDPEAPVTMIEYASFTCPHCKTFHESNFERLKEEYIDTGDVHFIYREVYFDRFGLWAGMVARCGGPERYFGIVELLYERQAEWLEGGEPAEIAGNLRRLGLTAGLEADELDACLQDGAKAEAMYAEFQRNAEADGIDSTPSFVIDGQTYSNQPYEDLAALIEDRLD